MGPRSAMSQEVRRTQRAPLSCMECYSRKLKCSKEIPCRRCISRGRAADCTRETVSVRGQIVVAQRPQANPSYETLAEENARLRAQLAQLTSQEATKRAKNGEVGDALEYYERQLFRAVTRSPQVRTVSDDAHIAWPLKACSDYILDHAACWTNWMHFTVFAPTFRREHEEFWSRFSRTHSLIGEDPLWLAVYFSILASALLFMNDIEFRQCTIPQYSYSALLRNWYDSALYLLDAADFLQRCDVAVIRATSIVGLVAINLGDSVRHENLRACALRVGQRLNLGRDHLNLGETLLQQEERRRLWWEIVICEWLSSPGKLPCIVNPGFDCALPLAIDDHQLLLCVVPDTQSSDNVPFQVQYHIIMARIASVYNELRSKLCARDWSDTDIAEIVNAADNDLAAIVDELPPHLQNDESPTPETRERDSKFPWITWQRTSLTLVLLYHRVCINRVLQQHHTEGSVYYARARSISISSASGIIRAAHSMQPDKSRLRSWSVLCAILSKFFLC
jgi:Fungal specific transcription factor domain/Fungal Zn(2)-Cys(6) binuclear cluster domain